MAQTEQQGSRTMNVVWIINQEPGTTSASPRHAERNSDWRSCLTCILKLQQQLHDSFNFLGSSKLLFSNKRDENILPMWGRGIKQKETKIILSKAHN